MEYPAMTELAEQWKISQRRVAIYCKEGRLEGAVMKGRTWLAPNNVKKPEAPRRIGKIIE